MRTLVVSDKVEPILYSGAVNARVGDLDLVLSCGDLPFYYIDFLVSMLNKPTYYVFGNHGSEVQYHSGKGDSWQVATAPQGATDLHCRTVKVGPLLLAGLEGSMRYNDSSTSQYTDTEMWFNVGRLAPQLLYNRLRYGRWLDVLITHSPPFGIHDREDLPHTGFRSFLPFMRWFKPRYLLHGHIHLYRGNEVTETCYAQTTVINVYPYRILELEPQQL
ncbi:MAG: metallophosphoesterase [Caldilineaceae bacterium]